MPYKNLEKRREFQREQMRRLRKEHPEKYKHNSKKYNEYYLNGGNKIAAEKYVKEKKENPEKLMLKRIKVKAKQKGIPFNLEEKDIIIPKYCPFLGLELKMNNGIINDNSPTLDKIEPSLGYVKGNIQVISAKANAMKYTASFEDFEKMYLNWKTLNEGVII